MGTQGGGWEEGRNGSGDADEWEWVWTRGWGGWRESQGTDPASYKALLRSTYLHLSRNRAGQGTLRVPVSLEEKGLRHVLGAGTRARGGAPLGFLLVRATELSLKQGRLKGCAPGQRKVVLAPGRDGEKEARPLSGAGMGNLGSPGWGRGAVGLPGFRCCLGKAQPRDPYPGQE